jgi:adenylate cyclase
MSRPGEKALSGGRVERRLAAILAADVAGYSRLMGADEEGTLDRLKALRRELIDPKIAEHKGRIVKTAGDGLLVEFGSVVDAVRCALAVQEGMAARNAEIPEGRRLEFRVGINLGDVIAEEDDIYGDGVNIAARLEALAEPGAVFVSNTVYEHVRDRLSFAFEDLGEQRVKNIARPLHVYRVGPRPSQRQAGEASTLSIDKSLALPDKPSLAVLPFANMSSDPEQEFLADGIAEDIITALSRYPSLFVIARNSSFTYTGRAVDVKEVGSELGVRYILEGSLRKADNRIRVTAQLVEAQSGNHVWAERYDRDLADIFAVQDEIAEAAAIAVAPAIAEAERQRAMRKPPGNLDAWAAYQRGLWHHIKFTVEDVLLAERFFQQAVDLDPNFAGGYVGLASTTMTLANQLLLRPLAEARDSALALARRAISLDPTNAEAYSALSGALTLRGDLEGARAEMERALSLCPNLATAQMQKAANLIHTGRPQQGLAAAETAVRLDPRSSTTPIQLLLITIGHYQCRDYELAVEAAKRTIRSYPDYPRPYMWLAAALGQLGRAEEASAALAKAVALWPAALDRDLGARMPWNRPEDHAHMLEGLRKAGWQS